ncbi:MAG: hypothetical protein IPJ01_10405 [Micavibrio sp.]|nr:hypothetical protein [Micavibrio sp.]
MAKPKSKVSFSIELLEANRKHHKKSIKTGALNPNAEKYMDKEMIKHIKKRQANHQRYYDDLTTAIEILKKKK